MRVVMEILLISLVSAILGFSLVFTLLYFVCGVDSSMHIPGIFLGSMIGGSLYVIIAVLRRGFKKNA